MNALIPNIWMSFMFKCAMDETMRGILQAAKTSTAFERILFNSLLLFCDVKIPQLYRMCCV